jgi:hypothetical protein
MKKYIILFLILNIFGIRYISLKHQAVKAEDERRIRVESYNAGFRAGNMDILARLVECENIEDKILLKYYETASGTLALMGELDSDPYPCRDEVNQ